MEKRTHLGPKIRKTTSVSVEDIIVNSPGNFNHLQRNLSIFYDALEANQLLRKGGLVRNYTLTEEIVENQGVCSLQGRRALMYAVARLQRGDGEPRLALYTCGRCVKRCRGMQIWRVFHH